MLTEGKGVFFVVGAIFVVTALIAYNAPLSGNDKVTVTLVGTLIALVVAELSRSDREIVECPHQDSHIDDGRK